MDSVPGILKHRSVPPILALSVVVLLALGFVLLGSSGSQGAATGTLARYMPPDSVAYAQTDLKPGGEAGREVSRAVRRLTGIRLNPAIDDLFDNLVGGIDYRTGVEPWLAGPVAVAAGPSREDWSLAAEVDDATAARQFEAGLREGGDLPAGISTGVIGDALVVAGSEKQFGRMSSAAEGDSLSDTDAFDRMFAGIQGEGIAQVFISNEALFDAVGNYGAATDGFDAGSVIETLGIDPEGTATAMSVEVDGDQISLSGESDLRPDSAGGEASDLIGSFPADAVLAAGVSGTGESAGELLDALEEKAVSDGPPVDGAGAGADSGPGGLLDQASVLGIDLRELVGSLETVGVFVTPDRAESVRGAIVATTSDPALIAESVDRISTFGALAGGDFFKPLPAELEGFSVTLPGVPGGRVAVGHRGDRLAIGLGLAPVSDALRTSGRTLADTPAFDEATASLEVAGINLFARPKLLAPLARKKAESHGARDENGFGKDLPEYPFSPGRLLSAVESIAGGTGDGSFEVDLNLGR